MWSYVKPYLPYAILAGFLMCGEVLMDLVQPTLMSTIVDDGVLGTTGTGVGNMNVIIHTGLIMVCAALFGCFCGGANGFAANKCIRSVGNDMRKDAFSTILKLSFSQLDRFGTGSLITRVSNDITQVERLIQTFIRSIIRTGFLICGSIFFMFSLNPTFGLITLVVFPIALCLLIVCLKKATPLFGRLQSQLDQVNAIMQEDLGAMRTIKACVREFSEKGRFGHANANLVATQLKALLIFALLSPSMNCLMYFVIAVLLYVGGFQVEAGTTTPGVIMAAISYATQLLNSVLNLVFLSQEISRGVASWSRVKELLSQEPEIRDPLDAAGTRDGRDDSLCGASIDFDHVSFSYPDSETAVLEDISLHIEAGSVIAFIGSTGSAKTTLLNLIPRFYDVSAGCVKIDGIDVRSWRLEELRSVISIAAQHTELFGGSVRENISWGKTGADDAEILRAGRISQADSFVQELPGGYDTLLGEKGTSLSGGQRQRLSLARAVIKQSRILILDDATSALDLKTESAFRQALSKECQGITTLLVTQRVASARDADRIVVLDNHHIAACGTHAELLESCDIYKEIFFSQFGEVQ